MAIYIGGTGDANKLDDYEEGTWTPLCHDGSGINLVLSGTSGNCHYSKIGRVVNITAQITRNETGGRSGRMEITQLPFTSLSAAQLHCGSWWMDRGTGHDTTGGGIYVIGSNTKLRFVNPSAVHTNQGGDDAAKAATRYLEADYWPNGRHIYFNLTYMMQ